MIFNKIIFFKKIFVGTGIKVKLVINNIEHDEAIAIISGDINGNGVVDVTDDAKITDYILGAIDTLNE